MLLAANQGERGALTVLCACRRMLSAVFDCLMVRLVLGLYCAPELVCLWPVLQGLFCSAPHLNAC